MENSGPDIVFGVNAVGALISRDPGRIDRALFAQDSGPRLFELLKRCRKLRIPTQMVPMQRLTELAGTGKHQGVVVRCAVKTYANADAILDNLESSPVPGLFLVPASLEDPRNLGAIVRSSAAFGVSAILLEKHNTVGLNATVAKSSAGMLEHMAICRPRSLEAVLKRCREAGYSIVGASADADTRPEQLDLRGPAVLIVGGEHRGIPPYLRKLCTATVGIPTDSRVPSLNVSVAAALLLYECAKQRAAPRA